MRKWKHSIFSLVFGLANDIILWQTICLKHYKRRWCQQSSFFDRKKTFIEWEKIQNLIYFTKQLYSKMHKKLMIWMNQSCSENYASQIALSCNSLAAMRKSPMQLSHTTQLKSMKTLKLFTLKLLMLFITHWENDLSDQVSYFFQT